MTDEEHTTTTRRLHDSAVHSVAYSPSRWLVASGSVGKTIAVWDTKEKDRIVLRLSGHSGVVTSLAFSHDGSLLISGSRDRTCRTWSMADSSCLHSLDYSSAVESLAVSSDGIAACGCESGEVALWTLHTSDARLLKGHAAAVRSVDFAPDGATLATGSLDWLIRLWDVASGTRLAFFLGVSVGPVRTLRFSPDGSHLASSSFSTFISRSCMDLWDVSNVSKLSSDTDQYLTWDQNLQLHQTRVGAHHLSPVRTLSFSPNGALLASGAWDGAVRVWDVSSKTHLHTLLGHRGLVTSLSWSYDGTRIVSGGFHDRSVRVWDVTGGMWKCSSTLHGHSNGVCAVLFADADNRYVLSASQDGTIRRWDTQHEPAAGEVIAEGVSPVSAIALSSDRKYLLSSTSHCAFRFSLADDEQSYISVDSAKAELRLIELNSASVVWSASVPIGQEYVHDFGMCVALSRDCTRALVGTLHGRLLVFAIPLECLAPTSREATHAPASERRALFKHNCNLLPLHVSFSENERAVVTNECYVPLEDSTLWPISAATQPAREHLYPIYIIDAEKIWRAAPDRRRICGYPSEDYPFLHEISSNRHQFIIRGSVIVQQHTMAIGTLDGRVVIVDLSSC